MKRIAMIVAGAVIITAAAPLAACNGGNQNSDGYTAVDLSSDVKLEKFSAELSKELDNSKIFGDVQGDGWSFGLAASVNISAEADCSFGGNMSPDGNTDSQNTTSGGNQTPTAQNQTSVGGQNKTQTGQNQNTQTPDGQNPAGGDTNTAEDMRADGKIEFTETLKTMFSRPTVAGGSALSVLAEGEARLKGDADIPTSLLPDCGVDFEKLTDNFDYVLSHRAQDGFIFAQASQSLLDNLPSGLLPENGKVKLPLPEFGSAGKSKEFTQTAADRTVEYLNKFINLAAECGAEIKVSHSAGFAVKMDADEISAAKFIKHFAGEEIISTLNESVVVKDCAFSAELKIDGDGMFESASVNLILDAAAFFEEVDLPVSEGDIKISVQAKISKFEGKISTISDAEKEDYTPFEELDF